MARRETIEVKVSANGDYWQGSWKDPLTGRRMKCGLGSKSDFSKRQAGKLATQKSIELTNNPSLASARSIPSLSEWIERYVRTRKGEVSAGTTYLYELAGRYLRAFFGDGIRIDRLTRDGARRWRAALKEGVRLDDTPARPMCETTACNTTKYAKAMFRQAVDDDLIPFNPFDKLRSSAPDPEKDWHYLSIPDFERILVQCPDDGWKALLGLCRLAGLRRGEAVSLKWSAVDLLNARLTVWATKTESTSEDGGKRVVPISPRLKELLVRAAADPQPGSHLICGMNANNLRRNFGVILKRSGVTPYAEPFQTMRRSCEQDWARECPQHAVSAWIGHDITISQRFYLKVTDDLYERVSGRDLPQNLPQTANTPQQTEKPEILSPASSAA